MADICNTPFLIYLAEDVGHNKLAAQYTLRELWEADEANLLDEDGMSCFLY